MQIRYVHFVYVLMMCDVTTPTLCSMMRHKVKPKAVSPAQKQEITTEKGTVCT